MGCDGNNENVADHANSGVQNQSQQCVAPNNASDRDTVGLSKSVKQYEQADLAAGQAAVSYSSKDIERTGGVLQRMTINQGFEEMRGITAPEHVDKYSADELDSSLLEEEEADSGIFRHPRIIEREQQRDVVVSKARTSSVCRQRPRSDTTSSEFNSTYHKKQSRTASLEVTTCISKSNPPSIACLEDKPRAPST